MERKTQKAVLGTVVLLFSLWMVNHTRAQGKSNSSSAAGAPPATYISNADLQAALKRQVPGPDRQVRVVNVNGEYNLAVGIVRRAKASAGPKGGVAHNEVAEVYHIIEGSGTLLTGGTIKDVQRTDDPGQPNGPGTHGSQVLNGTSQKVGPGDVVIIPANTPHVFTEITTDEIVYVVIRPDPHKVLPLM